MMAFPRRAFLLGPLAASLPAAEWDAPPFPQWSPETVRKLLVDSPWARPKSVRLTWYQRNEQPITYKDVPGANATRTASSTAPGGSPVGGIGAGKPKLPTHADLILRWSSALPIRQAKALYKQQEDKSSLSAALDAVETRPEGYALEIFGIPVEAGHKGTGALEATLRNGTVLRTRGGDAFRPIRVSAVVHSGGTAATLLFDRAAALAGAREIEVDCRAGLFEFRERFKIDRMTYLGHLEI